MGRLTQDTPPMDRAPLCAVSDVCVAIVVIVFPFRMFAGTKDAQVAGLARSTLRHHFSFVVIGKKDRSILNSPSGMNRVQ